jgi:hypothetical protein
MATLTLHIPENLKALAEARAAEAGFSNVGDFVAQLIVGEAAGAPEGLTVRSDAQLEKLLASRMDGPFVQMEAADFKQMRKKLQRRLGGEETKRTKGRQP